jgi:hypothetical protein
VVAGVLHHMPAAKLDSIEDVLACDAEARDRARAQIAD